MTTGAERDLSRRARAWVERTYAEQGIRVKVTDPLTLRKIADILGEAREAREESTRKSKRAA